MLAPDGWLITFCDENASDFIATFYIFAAMATEKVCSWCKAAPRKVGGYCEGCAKAYRRARHYFKTGGWRPKKVLRGVDAAMYERLFKHKEGREAEKPTK